MKEPFRIAVRVKHDGPNRYAVLRAHCVVQITGIKWWVFECPAVTA